MVAAEEWLSSKRNKSLCIPVRSGRSEGLFVEIFAEELAHVPASTLSEVLVEEKAPMSLWSDAGLLYMRQKQGRQSAELLKAACELTPESEEEYVRVLASAGIACLGDDDEDVRSLADNHFNAAVAIDQLYPMTWIGRGMMNLAADRFEQANFFFDTTLQQCGNVLPALLGMAALKFRESDYASAQTYYAKAIACFPQQSGAATRVGFALSCYKLGQVDRAKAAFQRALDIDQQNVEAMIGIAILDMASFSPEDVAITRTIRTKQENAIKLISMANLIDHSNAMVQNHLANHYFWKWTPIPGVSVHVQQNSNLVKSGGPLTLDGGERIRIGQTFETSVVEDDNDGGGGGNLTFKIKDFWKFPNADGLKLWKKDYERVIALAKGAHSSTTVPEIQAESLFILARVYHVKDEIETAQRFYERACKLAPDLSPARFGLAQTLIWNETYDEAAAHLRLVLGTSSSATDALAALGLLEVKAGKDLREAFSYLKRAIDLDPLNPELVLLEALAFQKQESDFPQSLERYRKAVQLMENNGTEIPWDVLTNMGVLCHETKRFDEALVFYTKALKALKDDESANETISDDGYDCQVQHAENALFWTYVDTGVCIQCPADEERTTTLTILHGASLPQEISVGSHVRIGDVLETQIEEVKNGEIVIKSKFVSPAAAKPGNNKGEVGKTEDVSVTTNDAPPKEMKLYVKRSNKRLTNPSAISVAFNLARLHEAAGRIVPAVELHKAIVKRHPYYVNSYLRLACIARDCGSLKDCSEWLKSACAVAPGNPEVLTLVGNLHLSLCDWAPAQSVFDQLLMQKGSKVEAYSMLSLGNIYFNNLKTPKKYTKHLQFAADLYKRILSKDTANAYAANGLGTVLAEKGELVKAKEVFHRVREVTGDTIPDTLLNLGHIHLAQKRHPESLQMYQSYMNRTRNTGAPITSKSQDDDDAEVLLYIAFAYFDWARQTELFNNVKAAPADDRYKKCIEHLELAMKKSKKENVLLRYNWCMTKLQAANCVLQKLTRNIRRTAQEVQEALDGLEESLPVVQMIIAWKQEGKSIRIASSMLHDFVSHCKANIESAKSHLSEERMKEAEANELRELQRLQAESQQKEREMELLLMKQKLLTEQDKREIRAREKMDKVSHLVMNWELEADAIKKSEAKKKDKHRGGIGAPQAEDDVDDIYDDEVAPPVKSLFDDDDSDDDDSNNEKDDENRKDTMKKKSRIQFKQPQQSDEDEDENDILGNAIENEKQPKTSNAIVPIETEKELFGGSSTEEESDEELVVSSNKHQQQQTTTKRIFSKEQEEEESDEQWNTNKKRRVMTEEEGDSN